MLRGPLHNAGADGRCEAWEPPRRRYRLNRPALQNDRLVTGSTPVDRTKDHSK